MEFTSPIELDNPRNASLLARFEKKALPEPNSGCWLWNSTANDSGGYGMIGVWRGNRMYPRHAHRVAWTLYRGAIPVGLHVCHKCDNRACVNPDHLFVGTRRENMQDMYRKGRDATSRGKNPGWLYPERTPRGSSHYGAKLTEIDIAEIKSLIAAGVIQRRIAARFGVCPAVITHIKKGKSWTHVA